MRGDETVDNRREAFNSLRGLKSLSIKIEPLKRFYARELTFPARLRFTPITHY